MYDFKRLSLRQLDRSLRTLTPPVPRKGWLRRVRTALGLSQAQVAQRLGVSQQSFDRMEKREVQGKVTLETLAEAAQAMDARLVYFLVPALDNTFEDLLKRRAREAAERMVSRIDRHMALEDQQVSAEALQDEIDDLASELFRTFADALWEPTHEK